MGYCNKDSSCYSCDNWKKMQMIFPKYNYNYNYNYLFFVTVYVYIIQIQFFEISHKKNSNVQRNTVHLEFKLKPKSWLNVCQLKMPCGWELNVECWKMVKIQLYNYITFYKFSILCAWAHASTSRKLNSCMKHKTIHSRLVIITSTKQDKENAWRSFFDHIWQDKQNINDKIPMDDVTKSPTLKTCWDIVFSVFCCLSRRVEFF